MHDCARGSTPKNRCTNWFVAGRVDNSFITEGLECIFDPPAFDLTLIYFFHLDQVDRPSAPATRPEICCVADNR